ncbi:FUSC family protein [Acidocella sp.]|uniref:FUSC family protein n=1 Tax=Acidocella sp. TaxID=50710 RepID=UPI0026244695|nr:FUSC family protein [Acidocella sp.]
MTTPQTLITRLGTGLMRGTLLALAAGLAYAPSHWLGLRQEFWGSITAILVLQTEMRAMKSMAHNQALGGVIGGAIGLALVLMFGDSLPVYLLGIILAGVLCHELALEGATQVSAVTITILMLVPHTESMPAFLATRLAEVALGIAVGAGIGWAALISSVAPPAQRG